MKKKAYKSDVLLCIDCSRRIYSQASRLLGGQQLCGMCAMKEQGKLFKRDKKRYHVVEDHEEFKMLLSARRGRNGTRNKLA